MEELVAAIADGSLENFRPGRGQVLGLAGVKGEVVRWLADGQPRLTDEAKAELARVMEKFLPGALLTWMIGLGADAVGAEVAAESVS